MNPPSSRPTLGVVIRFKNSAATLPAVLAAPELVAPWPGKVAFHATCRGAVQRLHDRAWAEAKARAIILAETR